MQAKNIVFHNSWSEMISIGNIGEFFAGHDASATHLNGGGTCDASQCHHALKILIPTIAITKLHQPIRIKTLPLIILQQILPSRSENTLGLKFESFSLVSHGQKKLQYPDLPRSGPFQGTTSTYICPALFPRRWCWSDWLVFFFHPKNGELTKGIPSGKIRKKP